MPDITMCKDTECGQRMQCYRFRAIPNEHRQSYFAGVVRMYEADDSCEYYLIVRPNDTLTPHRVPGKLHLTVVK